MSSLPSKDVICNEDIPPLLAKAHGDTMLTCSWSSEERFLSRLNDSWQSAVAANTAVLLTI